jgi:hypothetical protein
MIAVRTFFKSTSTRKPRASKARPSEPTGDLVRGDESVHGGMETMGSILVGRRTRSLDADLSAESTVGPNSSGADPIAERECGA